MRSLAQRLIDFETRTNAMSEVQPAATFPVTDKLRPQLTTLLGHGGVRALLSRVLVLATEEVSWLGAAQVNAAGTFEGLETLGLQLEPAEFLEGRVVMLAQLLGLLVAFIGPSLTSRLVGEIWLQVPLNERDFGKEVNIEKAN